ncbi:F0F1 ATP synthase subunit delta [Bacillota bacterium]
MAELTVDKTYAKGLFLAASDGSKADEIMEEAKELSGLFEREKDFFDILCSPAISGHGKKQIIQNVFTNRLSREMLNFLMVLVDKGRVAHLPRIVRQYEKLLLESHGLSRGLIYSAVQLSPEKLRSFEEKTGSLIGKKTSLENRIDKSLIGGVRIFVEGRLIDASVKKRLSDMKDTMASGLL